VGFLLVPWVARRQIVKLCRDLLHREATVERVRFNPFTLAGSVEGFDLKDRDGADLLRLSRFAADFQVSGIFRRAWRFREVSIEQPLALARILADGRPSVVDLLEPKATPPEPGPPKPFPRILVDRFVLSGGRVGFEDATRTPPFTETLAPLDLDLHELTTIPDESGAHEVTIGLGETAKVRW
jgi:hypothetical protein